MAKSTLSKRAIEELLHFVAVNGEGYLRYKLYAEKNGWYVFSEKYLHNWVNRHRPAIQTERHRHMIEVRKKSTMDRQQRITTLERRAADLEALLFKAAANEEASVETTLKIVEMQRKVLQAIAQENGEWNTKPDQAAENTGAHAKLADALMSKYLSAGSDDSPAILVAGVDELPERDDEDDD